MLKVALDTQLGDLKMECDFELPRSGVTVIFGRSGAGKTSLINYISGLLKPHQGRISLNGRDLTNTETKRFLPPEKRSIGYVFQEALLFPHYSVQGNLLYGSEYTPEDEKFQSVVEMLDIQALLQRLPNTLSGGEKQRVAIGRALLSDPGLLLMDEPLASLDLPRKKELLPYLAKLAKEVELPILYVTHSLEEIIQLADYLVLLEQGKILQFGNVEEVWSSEQMRPWLSGDTRSSLFNATLDHHHPRHAMSCLNISHSTKLWMRALDMPPGTALRVRIKANDVSLSKEQPQQTSIRNILPATIMQIDEESSHQIEVVLNIGGCKLWSHITCWALTELNLKVGDKVYAQIKGISVTQEDWSGL
ncbi:molybdenum ABC transporter ATP-binding protein ModC [Neptuniibacter sp. SY11_33]|uniref:molybdenum ABC transporter ATP-binding protein ModC n=1 Tax=Neptuniibacter sp. SY11_33 TaxID=3398215 RepID=UPI0039F4EB8C